MLITNQMISFNILIIAIITKINISKETTMTKINISKKTTMIITSTINNTQSETLTVIRQEQASDQLTQVPI